MRTQRSANGDDASVAGRLFFCATSTTGRHVGDCDGSFSQGLGCTRRCGPISAEHDGAEPRVAWAEHKTDSCDAFLGVDKQIVYAKSVTSVSSVAAPSTDTCCSAACVVTSESHRLRPILEQHCWHPFCLESCMLRASYATVYFGPGSVLTAGDIHT